MPDSSKGSWDSRSVRLLVLTFAGLRSRWSTAAANSIGATAWIARSRSGQPKSAAAYTGSWPCKEGRVTTFPRASGTAKQPPRLFRCPSNRGLSRLKARENCCSFFINPEFLLILPKGVKKIAVTGNKWDLTACASIFFAGAVSGYYANIPLALSSPANTMQLVSGGIPRVRLCVPASGSNAFIPVIKPGNSPVLDSSTSDPLPRAIITCISLDSTMLVPILRPEKSNASRAYRVNRTEKSLKQVSLHCQADYLEYCGRSAARMQRERGGGGEAFQNLFCRFFVIPLIQNIKCH